MRLPGVKSVPAEAQKIAPLLAEWSKERPYAGADRDRRVIGASRAGSCSRALAYDIAGVEPTDPMTESGFHATGIGSLCHDAIQERLGERPEYGVEVPWRLVIDVDGSDVPLVMESAADYVENGVTGVDELGDIKTTKPFGFRMKVTKEGPDRGHLLQVGLGMKALGAARGRFVLITPAELTGRDRIDTDGGEHDFRDNRYHEWVFEWADLEALTEGEVARLAKIRRYLDEGRDVPRTIPGTTPPGAVVVDPAKGVWQEWVRPEGLGADVGLDGAAEPVMMDQGSTWRCRYCPWQTRCVSDVETGARVEFVEVDR